MENEPVYSSINLRIRESFFASPEYRWLRQQEDGATAFAVYVHMHFRYGGLMDGAFESRTGDDPSAWIPGTAMALRQDFPLLSETQMEKALSLLRSCGLLKVHSGKAVQPFMYSDRKDIFATWTMRIGDNPPFEVEEQDVISGGAMEILSGMSAQDEAEGPKSMDPDS